MREKKEVYWEAVEKGIRVDGRDEDGLKYLPLPEFEGLGSFYFSRGILPGCLQTLLNHGILHPCSHGWLVSPRWGKLRQKTDLGGRLDFSSFSRLALGTRMRFGAGGDAGCNFHTQLLAGAPSPASPCRVLQKTPAWSGRLRGRWGMARVVESGSGSAREALGDCSRYDSHLTSLFARGATLSSFRNKPICCLGC